VVQTLREKFIAVAVDADALNYMQDSEGRFARDSKMRLPGSCHSISYITASGKVLGTEYQMPAIEEAWQAWTKLPEGERKPGAIQVGKKGPLDPEYAAVQPPEGGLILKLYGRYLAREDDGELRLTTLLKDFPGIADPATRYPRHFDYYCEANPDYMWLTEAEWKSLIPANPKRGDQRPVPTAIIDRMCLYHLLPTSMHSRIGDLWQEIAVKTKGIRAKEVTLTVDEASPDRVRLILDGFVHLGHAYDADATAKIPPKSSQCMGYEARLRGVLDYDTAKRAITRFDILVLGDLYGDADPNGWLVRPGRNPLGFAFEMVAGDNPVDRLPPRGYLTKADLAGYLREE
jgi:hypothetical protein